MVAYSSAYATALMERSAATGSNCTTDSACGLATAALPVRVVVAKVPFSGRDNFFREDDRSRLPSVEALQRGRAVRLKRTARPSGPGDSAGSGRQSQRSDP